MQGTSISLTLPLNDFAKAYDGPPRPHPAAITFGVLFLATKAWFGGSPRLS
jgi:hypothetical protein